MKTDELTGAALDWAVAKCEGVEIIVRQENWDWYSSSWEQGGPIIEREKIATAWHLTRWVAWRGVIEHPGPTPLIAAMRCYVASRLGNDIEIPEELNV
jgi:hypothetical protein